MGAAPSRQETPTDSSRAGDGRAVPVSTSSAASATGSNSNQAQSKRPPAPHMFHEIVAQEKTATAAELEDQVHGEGVYLAGKTKKYWVHEKSRCNCFMLFPRGLSITWSDDPRYWSWHPLKETSDSEIEAASLQNVCWLEIHGKLELSHLTPGVNYDVVFEVMLTEAAYGWSTPVNLRLKFPDGTVQERKENLQERPRKQWLELRAGEVKTQPGQMGEVEISLFEYDAGLWKKGLLVKGIKIVPSE
ncbi:Protein PHLOEM PROTEIN 2-LIKE A1 [Dichanthelium oligosanthes]|uniref:Protein PHLOEM PROTEIN 2-LIKE A1 n=1 Tax=Dichanthelium oligosanthes TaxID=888268 RepID=A0A1E5WEZ4_9POAL|nr:Protein PHLOEM PROTEIN 2-LIKE A1 [Dichanthelium oligosanthes]